MFRISTEQPDEEPEPAHWKRMMSNLSDMSDRPLELGNSTEVFRMQTQEILSSASQSADAGEGSSDKPPQLSSSSSSPSRNVLQEEALQEEAEKEAEAAEAEKAELAKEEEAKEAEKELQEEPQKEQEAPAPADQAEQAEQAEPAEPAEQEQEAPEAQEPGKPSPPTEPESSEPTASASEAEETARKEPSEPSSAADFLVTVPPEEERKPVQDRPRESKSSSITPPVPIRGDSPQENDAVRKVVTKTPTQFPSADTPRRRGLNSSLIGAPADKIREIASHLTSGQPPVYSPAASSPASPAKKRKPEKASKASKA